MLVCIDRETAFCSMALVRVVLQIQADLTGHPSIEITVLIPPTRTSSETMSTKTLSISHHSTDIDASLEKSSLLPPS